MPATFPVRLCLLKLWLLTLTAVGEWGPGMAQWWEHSPPTSVARVWFPDSASYVGWVCCWFSSLLWGFFSGYSDFPPSTKTNMSKFQFNLETGLIATLWMCHRDSHLLFILFIEKGECRILKNGQVSAWRLHTLYFNCDNRSSTLQKTFEECNNQKTITVVIDEQWKSVGGGGGAVLEASLYGRVMDTFWNKKKQFSHVLNSNVKWLEGVSFAYQFSSNPTCELAFFLLLARLMIKADNSGSVTDRCQYDNVQSVHVSKTKNKKH